jgi:hypothetical protein
MAQTLPPMCGSHAVTSDAQFVTFVSPPVTAKALRYPNHGRRVAVMGHMTFAIVLIVRLFDGGAMPPPDRNVAIDTASAILLASNIPTTWPPCAFRCAAPPEPGDLVVRVVRGASAKAGSKEVELGYSVIDPATRSGVLATVYLDRAQRVASQAHVAVGVVVGRAIAHEIGHLLLGTASHEPQGLMRAVWSPASLRGNHARDWSFTPTQAAALHRVLEDRVPVGAAQGVLARR